MRDDFAIFILTHGRPHCQKTYDTLMKSGYTGKVYLVVDNLDETIDAYKENYGGMVIEFDKEAEYKKTDTFTNRKILKGVVYARNVCFDIAKKMGIRYFANCDDDIKSLTYKMPVNGKLKSVKVHNMDKCLESILQFMETSRMECVSFSEEGFYVGGINEHVRTGQNWSLTHFFIMDAESKLRFRSVWFEDYIFSIEKHRLGERVISLTQIAMQMPSISEAKKQDGGMRKEYNATTEYAVAMTPVLTAPDCAQAYMKKGHIKSTKKDNAFMVKILNERWRKNA